MRKPTDPANESPIVGLEQYYEDFRQSRLGDLDLMISALHLNDFTVINALAHKWRGYCAPYGFGMLAQIAQELEAAAEVKDREVSEKLFEEAHTYLAVTKKKGDS